MFCSAYELRMKICFDSKLSLQPISGVPFLSCVHTPSSCPVIMSLQTWRSFCCIGHSHVAPCILTPCSLVYTNFRRNICLRFTSAQTMEIAYSLTVVSYRDAIVLMIGSISVDRNSTVFVYETTRCDVTENRTVKLRKSNLFA
jgi:hypothetical protein